MDDSLKILNEENYQIKQKLLFPLAILVREMVCGVAVKLEEFAESVLNFFTIGLGNKKDFIVRVNVVIVVGFQFGCILQNLNIKQGLSCWKDCLMKLPIHVGKVLKLVMLVCTSGYINIKENLKNVVFVDSLKESDWNGQIKVININEIWMIG